MTLTEPFPWNGPALTIDSLKSFEDKTLALMAEQKWILISPNGEMWSGSQAEVARELLRTLALDAFSVQMGSK